MAKIIQSHLMNARIRRTALAILVALPGLVIGFALSPGGAAAATSGSDPAYSPYGPNITCPDGSVRIKPNPPAAFDPLTATNDELEQYSYPPRPSESNPHLLAVWQKFVTSPIDWGSCPSLAQAQAAQAVADAAPPAPLVRAGSPAASGNHWSGNIATGHTYWSVEGYIQNGCCSMSGSGWLYLWNGIGQGGSSAYPLVQAGFGGNYPSSPFAWTEVYPQQAHPVAVSALSGHVGWYDVVYVHAIWLADGSYKFNIDDLTSGIDWHSDWQTTTGSRDGTAEWITEGPTGPPIPKFSVVGYDLDKAGYGSTYGYIDGLPHSYSRMTDSAGNVMVYPDTIDPGVSGFNNVWWSST